MVTVFDVSNWFLLHEGVTHKKLQKLCYYSQAWYCALFTGEPLFSARIEAWVHGPVIPELHRQYASYGWDTIPRYEGNVTFSEKENSVLEAVYDTYWQFSGDQLEALTRQESPWRDARIGLEPWQICTNEITTKSMRDYYLRKYIEAQGE